MKIGIICASDNELAPLTVDMETAGIAHVCYERCPVHSHSLRYGYRFAQCRQQL